MEERFHSHHSNRVLKTAIVAIMVCGTSTTRSQFVTENNMKAGKNDQSLTDEREREAVYRSYTNVTWALPESTPSSSHPVSFIFSRRLCARSRCTHHGVGVSGPLQVTAALSVGVGADTQTVGGVELLHEERTAGLNHRRQLQQAGGRQQRLDGVLPQLETPWKTKRRDITTGDAAYFRLKYVLFKKVWAIDSSSWSI